MYHATADFIGQRYTNTVSYFNTYYNAQHAFDDAEKEVLAVQKAQQGKPVLPSQGSSVPQTARTKFTTAIEKASKLLSYYPTCKWVDDALLLIGKSYFYLEDDLKAERKFLELFAKFPDSDLRLETELWYGRSLLRQKRYDEGVQSLENLYAKAAEKKEKDIAGLAALVIGKYFFEKQEYEKAAKYFQQSVSISNDDDLNAETQLQIGYCYRALKDFPKAAQAFSSVEDFNPDYTTAFTAKLENVRILSDLHKYDEALTRLFEFLDDAKNAENFSKVHLEIGNIYLSQNRIDDAIQKFSYTDTAFAKTDEAAKAYFSLGKIYETIQNDYAKARLSYDKAKVEYPASQITADAIKKADAFGKYFTLRTDVTKYDSLIADLRGRKAKRDSLSLLADTLRQIDSTTIGSSSKGKSKSISKEEQKKLQTNRDSLARLDSIKIETEKRLIASEKQNIDSLQQLIVKSRFELAGTFYLEINQPDSALFWFQKVINESAKSELAPRASFTVAEIYRTSKGKESRKAGLDSLYAVIVAKYPESPYAQESRRVLGLPLLAVQKDPAEELYMKAETYMEGTRADSALYLLYRLMKENSSSPFSAKALYSIGWLYENKLEKRDSASAVYRRLIAGYPESQFAVAVRPKIQEEDQARKEAEQKAKEELDAIKKKEAEEKKKKDDEEQKAATPATEKKLEKEPNDEKPKTSVTKDKP